SAIHEHQISFPVRSRRRIRMFGMVFERGANESDRRRQSRRDDETLMCLYGVRERNLGRLEPEQRYDRLQRRHGMSSLPRELAQALRRIRRQSPRMPQELFDFGKAPRAWQLSEDNEVDHRREGVAHERFDRVAAVVQATSLAVDERD